MIALGQPHLANAMAHHLRQAATSWSLRLTSCAEVAEREVVAFLECGAIGASPLAHVQPEIGSLTLVMAVGTEGEDGRSVAITGCKRIGR